MFFFVCSDCDPLLFFKAANPSSLSHRKVRLINPAKNELGRKSKTILDNINMKLFQATKINQWKNTISAIKWSNSLKAANEICYV